MSEDYILLLQTVLQIFLETKSEVAKQALMKVFSKDSTALDLLLQKLTEKNTL